jgi:glycosyltransferase involved in cell wall biosynthesis
VKILHIVPVYFPEGPGGIQLHVQGLVRSQRAAGHAPSILAGSLATRAAPEVLEEVVDGQRVLRLHRDDLHHLHHARGHHAAASRLARQVYERERPDVVHVHQWIALSDDLVQQAEELGLPTLVTLHDFLVSCPRCYRQDHRGQACLRPLSLEACGPCAPRLGGESAREIELGIECFRSALAAELARARIVWALTPGAVALFERLAGIAPGRIEALGLGYRPYGAPGSLRLSTDPAPAQPLRLAQWGRLGWHKGSDVLLEGFRRLCAEPGLPAVELHLLGPLEPADYAADLARRAAGLPVRFHGPFRFEDLQRLAPQVACFPTRCVETHGFVLDEARELGLPMLVGDLGAYGERAGNDCLKVAPEDPAAWAEALSRLVRDGDLRRRLAAAAPPLPQSPEQHAEEVERGYRRALAGPPRPALPAAELERLGRLRRELEALQRASKPWLVPAP